MKTLDLKKLFTAQLIEVAKIYFNYNEIEVKQEVKTVEEFGYYIRIVTFTYDFDSKVCKDVFREDMKFEKELITYPIAIKIYEYLKSVGYYNEQS